MNLVTEIQVSAVEHIYTCEQAGKLHLFYSKNRIGIMLSAAEAREWLAKQKAALAAAESLISEVESQS